MTACKMGRPTKFWAAAYGGDLWHTDDMPAPHADFAPGNMGSYCKGVECTSPAPRTDSARLDWLFSNDSEDCSEILKGMDTGYYECLDDGRVRLREAIDAAMDREGESNG